MTDLSAVGAGKVARAAGRTALAASRPIVNIVVGAGYFWRGAAQLATSPVLWIYALVPIAAVLAILYGLNAVATNAADAAIAWGTSFAEDWPHWIHGTLVNLLSWSAFLAIESMLGYAVLPMGVVVGAPCYVLLARRLERRFVCDPPAAPPSVLRACGVAVRQAVLITVVLQLGWLLMAPLLLVPGFNLMIAFTIVTVFNGFLVGLLVLAIPLHHHGTGRFGGQVRAAWGSRASVVGFGAMSALALSIPLAPVRAAVAPMVFTGAVLLHRRIRGILPIT